MQHQQQYTDTKGDWRYNSIEGNILDRDQSGHVSVASDDGGGPSYTHNADKSDPIDPHLADMSGYTHERGSTDTLSRDRSSNVSVSSGGGSGPSYTHNAETSEPLDPHLSEKNKPGWRTSPDNTEDTVLDRDRAGVVSVSSSERQGKPSYTHNDDSSD